MSKRISDIDMELLGPDGAPHASMVDAVNRDVLRVYGVGGIMVLVMVVAALVVALQVVSLSPFQGVLVAFGALLVGLSIVGGLGRRRAVQLRAQVREHCALHGTSPEELVELSLRLGPRWIFFRGLWDEPSREVAAGLDNV